MTGAERTLFARVHNPWRWPRQWKISDHLRQNVQANISFRINGFPGDISKDLAVIEQFTLLEEDAEVKEIATHPLSSQIAHPMGLPQDSPLLPIVPGMPPKDPQ